MFFQKNSLKVSQKTQAKIFRGPMAQLVERYYGIVEVAGSSPAGSTILSREGCSERQGAGFEIRWVSAHVGSNPTPSACN